VNTYSADFTQKRAVASVARAVGLNDLADKFEASFYVSYAPLGRRHLEEEATKCLNTS